MKKTIALFAALLSLLTALPGCRNDTPDFQETQEDTLPAAGETAATEPAGAEETEAIESKPAETEPAETESGEAGQYGNCTRCGVGIYDWNFQIESFEGYCRDCYLETLDPALICDNCGRDGSFTGMIDGLCEPCYWEIHASDGTFCANCGCSGAELDENGLCESCARSVCDWCGGPLSDSHNCDDYPNVICPNCGWGMFTTGVGVDGIVCPECGTPVV